MENSLKIKGFDERRDIAIAKNQDQAILFAARHFTQLANEAIKQHGGFYVALSGGSTPKAIFQTLASESFKNSVNWNRVFLFWGDERAVAPDHQESNYLMAMKAGFSALHVPESNIFRMEGQGDLEYNAKAYEALIRTHVPHAAFDLVMLGMGEDGHTASLFPKTHALHASDKLVVANYVPQKETWRLTLTYECINSAKHIAIYVLGQSKADMVERVLEGPYLPDELPIQKVGTGNHKALWILDEEAGAKLNSDQGS